VGWPQVVFGSALCLGLLAVAGAFLWFQARVLHRLADEVTLTPNEVAFQRRAAYRRIAAGLLMFVLAVLLAGAMVFLEGPAQALADWFDAFPDPEKRPPLTDEQRDFARRYGTYWLVILGLLFALLVIGAWDYLATRRFMRREQRRIREDRKAMIAREADRMRRERDGYHTEPEA